MFVVLPNLIYT